MKPAKPKRSLLDHPCFRSRSALELVSYDGMSERSDHVLMNGQYIRTLYMVGYPYVVHSGWLNDLIHFNRTIDIAFHIEELDSELALPKLERKITELESTKRAMLSAGKIVGSELSDPLESAIALKDRLLRGQQKLFLNSLYMTIRAASLDELNAITKQLQVTLAGKLLRAKVARFQQLEGISSVMPRGEDRLSVNRNLDSASLALCFPFVSSELSVDNGILYGVNKSNNSLVLIDRFGLNNANSITFAQSGSGKSYASKVEILRQLMLGTDVLVIDPEREYVQLAESLKGSVVRLSADAVEHINLFDRRGDSRSVSEHVQDVTDILSVMAGDCTARERALLDKVVVGLYKKRKEPLIEDLYQGLISAGELRFAERFEPYVNGSLAKQFNHLTDIDIHNRLVVFDIKDMADSARKLSMLLITNFVQQLVKTQPKKRLLVIDEAWLMLEQSGSARFVAGLVRRARKYWLGVSIISQQANDFLQSEHGRAIASQSALRFLMRQDTTTIDHVVTAFGLSEYERTFLLTCDKGDALIIADANHVALSVVASNKEHPLITTDPAERYAS